jgi:thioester reductase-like protein
MIGAFNINDANTWIWVLIGAVSMITGTYGTGKWITHKLADIAVDKSGVRELSAKIDSVQSQYRNNGGSSMKDAMDRVERALNELRLDAKNLSTTVQRIDIELARVKGYIEGAKDNE